jgi:hypothetical protein
MLFETKVGAAWAGSATMDSSASVAMTDASSFFNESPEVFVGQP